MKNWKPYQPDNAQPWNLLRVWTLHRRTGFAATWEELQRDLADGPQVSIERVLSGKSRSTGVRDDYAKMRETIGDSAVGSNRHERLIAWWLFQMFFTPHPLRERMAIVWHNHFATSNTKVKNLSLMREQNEVFRKIGTANFRDLLAATLKHGAMLKWLDGDENRAGKANENLGRETLELFTLGIGNYTESDVKNASRALTGWSVSRRNEFRIRNDWHDKETKQILGQEGNFDGDALVEITSSHPATAKRIAWRLCDEFLVKSLVTDERTAELAIHLTENDLDIGLGLKLILSSDLFYSDDNLKQRIVDPESFVVGACRAVEMFEPPPATMVLGDWVEQLGRKLFFPPNVGGWPGGRGWLNSRTTIARANFGVALANARLNSTSQGTDLVELAKRHIGNPELADVTGFYCQLLTGSEQEEWTKQLIAQASEGTADKDQIVKNLVALILASPEAQLG